MSKNAGRHITLVNANSKVVGDVHFTGELVVSGKVQGNLLAEENADASLELNQTGSVEGDIRVPRAVVCGQVTGNIFSGKHVVLSASARVEGDIYYKMIEVVKGAQVRGAIIFSGDEAGRITRETPAEAQQDEEKPDDEQREDEQKPEDARQQDQQQPDRPRDRNHHQQNRRRDRQRP